jgi:Holliday junction resolvasome RuvABC ATP-dependent DNA helicase subunit
MEEISSGNNLSIMFRGPSGHGKTHTTNIICSYVGRDNCHLFLGDELFDFSGERRINVLDEVHEVKNPEYIYKYMDSGNYTFLVCTNEYGNLKEPLVNRCIAFDLREYTLEELATLVKQVFSHHKMIIDLKLCSLIATYSRGNPRVAKILAKRSAMLFKRVGIPVDVEELIEFLKLYFDLDHGGFTHYDRQYLGFMQTNGRASLATLSRVLCIPQGTLLDEIEPFLLKQNLIQITNRGRIYTGEN